jgi:hypothetical protein
MAGVSTPGGPDGHGHAVESTNHGQATGITTQSHSAPAEVDLRAQFFELYKASPIPESEQLQNIGLFANRQALSRTLFFNQMYQEIVTVPGVIMEFGVRWGRDLISLQSFRGMYEPFNYTRKIIGYDTFHGFPSVHSADTDGGIAQVGSYATTDGYEQYLENVMSYHESESPLSHIRKHELVKGDVCETVPKYLAQHPETMIALAYFDLDLYEPTAAVLKAIQPHLTKGSVLGFDELNYPEFPGETVALREVISTREHRFRRAPFDATPCYTVLD